MNFPFSVLECETSTQVMCFESIGLGTVCVDTIFC